MSVFRNSSVSLAALAWLGAPALAADVTLVGLIGSKAIVVIDGAPPRTLAPGQKTSEGVQLLSTEKQSASFLIDGKTRLLRMGQAHAAPATPKSSITLSADSRGHFVTTGLINGGSVRFLVDTGATFVSLPAAEARRLGIDYLKGERARVQTANGVATAYRIRLDSVTIGDVALNGIDAVVSENSGMEMTLLGMSFLNRMEMKRDGPSMTLTKRY